MIPKKTNYSQAIIDTIDAQEIERSSKLANKGITDNELKSETFISTKRKKNFCNFATEKVTTESALRLLGQ